MEETPLTPQPPGVTDADIEVQIAEAESQLSSFRSRRAIYYFLLGGAVLGSIIMFFGTQIFAGPSFEMFARQAPLIGLATTAYFLLAAAYVAIVRQSRLASLKQELDVLRAKRRILERGAAATSEGAPPSYFDRLVDINVTNLEAYYGLVKVHTNNSFLVAISAGCIGFVLIMTGLIVGFINLKNAQTISYMSAGSGIVTEFISGVFFYLYNRTVRQLKEYHDSLIRVQNILLSFKIVGDTKDENRKNILMELMMRCLIATKPDLVSANGNESTKSNGI
jgi:hypothetical protein